MHPSYDIEEFATLQDDDPQDALFHAEVSNLVPYITLASEVTGYPIGVCWLNDKEIESLLQQDNKSPTNALTGERTK